MVSFFEGRNSCVCHNLEVCNSKVGTFESKYEYFFIQPSTCFESEKYKDVYYTGTYVRITNLNISQIHFSIGLTNPIPHVRRHFGKMSRTVGNLIRACRLLYSIKINLKWRYCLRNCKSLHKKKKKIESTCRQFLWTINGMITAPWKKKKISASNKKNIFSWSNWHYK